MAYQTYLNNRTHKPTMPDRFFSFLSTNTAAKPASSPISPSPDDIASSLTSSDSGTDSTFSFPTPIGFGSESQEPDLPNTTTFGDLGGFDVERKDDCPNGSTGGNTWNPNGRDIHISSSENSFSPGANTSSQPTMQSFGYNYIYDSDIGAGKSNTNTIPVQPAFVSSPTSTSLSSVPTSTPAPPPASSAPSTFQFSFRMTPPQTNNAQKQEQSQRGGGAGRRKTQSPTRNFPGSASTSTFPSDTSSKPLTLQFNTRNGQSVLSLSTPAREAAALKEKMKKEKQERNAGASTNTGDHIDGTGENAPMGSRGKERGEVHARDESLTWRNIKPAPAPRTANPYPSPTPFSSTSGPTLTPHPTLAQTHSQQPPPPSLQQYHDTYVPYDMYEELIHDSIGSQMVGQHQFVGQHQASAGLERAQAQVQRQPRSQAQNRIRQPNSSQDLHNAQVPQHFTSHFQLRNAYPSQPSPATTYTTTPTFSVQPNPNARVGNSMTIPNSQSSNTYPTIIQSGSEAQMNMEDSRQANVVGGALEQQRQNLPLASSTTPQNQYPTPQGAQMVVQPSNINNISTSSYPRYQQNASASTSIPVPPSAFFRRPNGACTRCKRMKMKCTFPPIPSGAAGGLHTIPEAEVELNLGPSPHPLPPSLACVRCAAANHPCIVEGRKPRTPSQREALLASLRQKDAIIATLLAPFQPPEANANIVLNGAKVIEAIDKGKDKATNDMGDDISSPAPDLSSPTGNVIGPVERAALLANDKGGVAKEGRLGLGYGKNKFASQKRLAVSIQNASANSSDEDSLSSDGSDYHDSDEDDVWDNEVERAVLDSSRSSGKPSSPSRASVETLTGEHEHEREREASASSATPQPQPQSAPRYRANALENQLKMHLHTLPPLSTPLGTIARLSLEGMGEKVKRKTKPARQHPKVKVEGDSEPSFSLAGQKRRRDIGDAGDEERDGILEDEDESDADEERFSSATDQGGHDNPGEDSDEETTERNGVMSSSADARSITLSDAQTLSLSGLVITESDGPAHRAYFAPGLVSNLPLRRIINARAPAPPILSSGLVTWEECETLFDIYYEYVHPYCSVLDPDLHTVQAVYERDPFLFTVILAVSSRYHTARPGLYKVAMHYAKAAAATAFVNGIKSVEMVQAYLIMCTYSLPARRWEEDRSWFYGGLAFRIATDLNLDKSFDDFKLNMKMGSLTSGSTKSLSERQEREKLNRMRTWLNCFNVDRSSSTQWGKPATLIEGEPIRKAREWWRCSLYNHPYDLHLVAYTELLRIVSRFHEQVYSDPMSKTGLNKKANFQMITEQIESDIKDWHDNTRWHYDSSTTKSTNSSGRSPTASSPSPAPTLRSSSRARASYSPTISSRRSPPMGDLESDPALIVRIEGVPVFENYMRLVMYSFGFEQAWRKWKARRSKSNKADASKNMMLTMDMDLDLDGGDMFFVKCLHAASAVVRHLSDVYGPSGYLKYAPDCFFVMGGFCGAFLLKMLRPAFAPLLDSTQRERIIQVVTRFVDTLDSPSSSIDATHTPRLYAKFLRGAMRDVMGSVSSSVDAEKASNLAEAAVTKATAQSQQMQASASSSSASTGPSASTPSLAVSSLGPPSLSPSHSQTPRSSSEECRTPKTTLNGSALRVDRDTGMGIDPSLIVSGPLRDQERSGNSGASTPLGSSTPTPTPTPSNSGFNAADGDTFDMQSRWSSLAQPQNQGLIQQENGFMGYLSQVHVSAQPHLGDQSWPQNGIRSTSADDLGVGLGAAVMARGADASLNNGVGKAFSYHEYMQSQPHDQVHLGSYSQSSYQLRSPYETGSLSWVNQQFVPYGALQQRISSQALSPPALTSNAMDLSEDEILATMRAVSSDNWNSSVIMPGYGWGPDEDVGMADI